MLLLHVISEKLNLKICNYFLVVWKSIVLLSTCKKYLKNNFNSRTWNYYFGFSYNILQRIFQQTNLFNYFRIIWNKIPTYLLPTCHTLIPTEATKKNLKFYKSNNQ